MVYEVGPRRAAAYQTWPAPSWTSSSTKGSKTWIASILPSRSVSAFSAMLRPASRVMAAGSKPARRMSSCRQSQGVGTSETLAKRASMRSAIRKVRLRLPPDDIERVARHGFGESHHRPVPVPLLILHHAHRPAPGDVGIAVEQACGGVVGAVGPAEFHLHAPPAVSVQFERQIKRSVEHGPERLEQLHHAL